MRLSSLTGAGGAMRWLKASTEPQPDAFDYRRYQTKGFLLFLHPASGRRASCVSRWVGRFRRRIEAFWDGCAFVS